MVAELTGGSANALYRALTSEERTAPKPEVTKAHARPPPVPAPALRSPHAPLLLLPSASSLVFAFLLSPASREAEWIWPPGGS